MSIHAFFFFLSRRHGNGDTVQRSMQVVFAPHLPSESCDFEVNSKGVQGLPKKLFGASKENALLGTRHDKCKEFLSTSPIPATPPNCNLKRNGDSVSAAGNSCERLFQISQSQRVVGTPPYTSLKQKDEVTVDTADTRDKKNSTLLQLKLFR